MTVRTTADYQDWLFEDVVCSDWPEVSLKVQEGASAVLRAGLRFCGVGLAAAALGLLLFPGGGESTAALLSKLMVALILGYGGVFLWQKGARYAVPELEIDMVQKEVRLVCWRSAERTVLLTRDFAQLRQAEVDGSTVRVWDDTDLMLAEVTIRDDVYLRSLCAALVEEGVTV